MSKAARRKGLDFERWVARNLSKALGAPVLRGLQSQGAIAPDVDLPGLWIECKRGKKTRPVSALAQAMSDATNAAPANSTSNARVPVSICKDDGQAVTVTMYYDDWVLMMQDHTVPG